jgi:hypothetical protein
MIILRSARIKRDSEKVMPQLDGSFIVNDAFENVDVRFKDDKAFLDYSTLYAKWSEEIITL